MRGQEALEHRLHAGEWSLAIDIDGEDRIGAAGVGPGFAGSHGADLDDAGIHQQIESGTVKLQLGQLLLAVDLIRIEAVFER